MNMAARPQTIAERENSAPAPGENVAQWLEMSQRTQDPQAALEYAQRAAHLTPDDPRVHETVVHSLFDRIQQDAFIAFLAETAKTYVVTLRDARPIVVPKDRAEPEIFPNKDEPASERAIGMLWWMLLGLIPVGIGSVLLSPLVANRALKAANVNGAQPRDRRMGWVTVLLSFGFGLVGAVFVLLLLLHLVG
jgi:hypothetical protein